MKETHERMLQQFEKMAQEGVFGESIKADREDYRQLPPGIAIFLKCVLDACSTREGINEETFQIRDRFMQLVILTYRDAHQMNQQVARALRNSFVADYPGAPESCLAPRLATVLQTALNFREVAVSTSRMLIWQQTAQLFLAYNEFLNALLGFMIPCLRCAQGKQPDPRIFAASFGTRLDQFNSLTGGENGAFYIITRLCKPRIRNAIAHSTIWLDSDAAKVHYTDGTRVKREYEMDLIEFVGLASCGSHLCEPYLAAIGAIVVMEDGSAQAQSLLPEHLVRLFRFKKAH